MAKPVARIGVLQAMLLLGAVVVVVRSAQLQLVQGGSWRAEADSTRLVREVIPARRGMIADRTGLAFVVTQEEYTVGIAPNELLERDTTVRTIARSLGLPLPQLRRAVASRRWINVPGRFNGLEVQPLRGIRGVHLEEFYQRGYPASVGRGVVGTLNVDSGRGASGIELALDTILAGTPGETVVLKDSRGRTYESPARLGRAAVAGADVWLTLDIRLQEIAERALDQAVEEFEASGGDIVMLDPRNGEVLALASRVTVDGKVLANRPTFFTDPYEPGSTAKVFTAAALLAHRRVKPRDSVFAENGRWIIPINSRGATRKIEDAHATKGYLTLAKALQVSSNIAIGKFSRRLSREELFESFRAFGFGNRTGVEYPSESPGSLKRPDAWDPLSQESIAMGYAFQVTPLQLAAAYGALANGGILLTPTLIREIRDPDGKVRYRHQPEPVRRAVPAEVTDTLLQYLKAVVGRGGTAEAAQIAEWVLVGKTGTAQRFDGTTYQKGRYNASFASIFPNPEPQLVVVVKINDPHTKVYGGESAAPLTHEMLLEALTARQSALDRNRPEIPVVELAETSPGSDDEPPEESRALVRLPLAGDSTDRTPQLIPNVAGANVRRAASTLLQRGFRVALQGTGRVARTSPAAGQAAARGTLVTVWAE